MTRLLKRMYETVEKEGRKKKRLIEAKRPHQNTPIFYYLPDRIAPNVINYSHELECANLYVAYQLTGSLEQWHWEPHEEYLNLGLKPDRVSRIAGKIIFWEVDMGTYPLERLHEKVEKYIALSKRHPDHRFHVIFTASKGRARNILFDVLADYKRGNQFLVGEHTRVLEAPLEPVFASPLQPNKALSIAELGMQSV
jgi:hypothetical protein